MARGGYRPGAGRKSKGNHLNPRAIEDIRQKIRAHAIIERLVKFIDGKVDMQPAAVTAALGLLRKIVPDLSAVEHSGEIKKEYVIRVPAPSPDMVEWQKRHIDLNPTTVQ